MEINLVRTISFVIPCYRSAETIVDVVGEIKATMSSQK